MLHHLLDSHGPVPDYELQETFMISRRTVYSDIQQLNLWLTDIHCAQVERVRGQGFQIHSDFTERIRNQLLRGNDLAYSYTPVERRAWIAILVMSHQDTFWFLENLSDVLLVSRNTILEDIKGLREDLATFQLELLFDRHTGNGIHGEEANIRTALGYFLPQAFPVPLWEHLTSYAIPAPIADVKEDFVLARDWIHLAEKELDLRFTDEMVHTLVLRLMFILRRITNGHNAHLLEADIHGLEKTPQFVAAKKMAKRILSSKHVDFPKNEIYYLATLLLSAKVTSDHEFKPADSEVDFYQMVKDIVDSFQKNACLLLRHREHIEESLLMHIQPAYYRLKYHIDLGTPHFQSIKEEYPYVYELTSKSIDAFRDALAVPVPEDEVAFIAMHFGGWLKREGAKPERRKKALLVCASGIGTSRLLKQQLESLFSSLDIVGPVSVRQYEEDAFVVDVIITTVSLQNDSIPVLKVEPILKDADKEWLLKKTNRLFGNTEAPKPMVEGILSIVGQYVDSPLPSELEQTLRTYVAQHTHVNEVIPSTPYTLSDLLQPSYVQLQKTCTSWQEAIIAAAEPLRAAGVIERSYVEAMISIVHSYGPYMVIAPGVSLPHARPEDGVKKLGMSILTLKQPVDFVGKPVQILFVIAPVDEHSHLEALSELTKCLNSTTKRNQLLDMETANKMSEWLQIGE
ncbi:BglG family transcription antiterminator [Aureibacillus halotolerans]|nr:BglG family transcription antiterminator [Aureibacillus halotolerans]